VLIVVGIVVAVCCVAGIAGGIYLFTSINRATGPARDAADAFVRELEVGDTQDAYNMLCRSTKERFSPDAFASGVRSQPRITGHRILNTTVNTVNGRSSAQVTLELSYESGFTERHSFLVVPEDDAWKVCGNPY
jgi:hypothetical protein